MVFVLTLDQRASRHDEDRVPGLIARLNVRPVRDGLLRPFERTAGDEVQGVLGTGPAVVSVLVLLLRADSWNVGLGMGPVDQPLPRSTRAGRGAAFVNARQAVTRAKSTPHHLSVVGANPYRAEQVETVLWLLAMVLRRRSPRGWEVADLLEHGLSRREVSDKLGVSQSAVSQRAQAAGVVEEQRARTLAAQLMADEEAW